MLPLYCYCESHYSPLFPSYFLFCFFVWLLGIATYTVGWSCLALHFHVLTSSIIFFENYVAFSFYNPSYLISAGFHFQKEYPFTTYGENVIILVQSMFSIYSCVYGSSLIQRLDLHFFHQANARSVLCLFVCSLWSS